MIWLLLYTENNDNFFRVEPRITLVAGDEQQYQPHSSKST